MKFLVLRNLLISRFVIIGLSGLSYIGFVLGVFALNVDGVDVVPGANLSGKDLSGLNLTGMDLTGVSFEDANLDGANLSFCKLTNAIISNSSCVGTNFDFVVSKDVTGVPSVGFSNYRMNDGIVYKKSPTRLLNLEIGSSLQNYSTEGFAVIKISNASQYP
jgi:hypothetical protein